MYMGEIVAPTKSDLWSGLLQQYVPQYSNQILALTGAKQVVSQPAAQASAAKIAAEKNAAKQPMTLGTKLLIGGGIAGFVGLAVLALRGRRSRGRNG